MIYRSGTLHRRIVRNLFSRSGKQNLVADLRKRNERGPLKHLFVLILTHGRFPDNLIVDVNQERVISSMDRNSWKASSPPKYLSALRH
jgi:hypothetical protein